MALVFRVGPLKEPRSRASLRFGDSGGWKWRVSRGSCPWEAQSVVFYEVRRLWELQILTALRGRVGLLRETKDRRPEDRRPETGGSK